jgi:chitin synthase
VIVAAFLEWFLWLAAFCYCLWKVYHKAENWRTKILAIAPSPFFVTFKFVADNGETKSAAHISSLLEGFSCPS